MSHASRPSPSPALTSIWVQNQKVGKLSENQRWRRAQKVWSQHRLALRTCGPWRCRSGPFSVHHRGHSTSLTASGLLLLSSLLQSLLDIQVKPWPPNSCSHHLSHLQSRCDCSVTSGSNSVASEGLAVPEFYPGGFSQASPQ